MGPSDEFEPRLGGLRDRGGKSASRARSFVSQVMAAAKRAGVGASDLGPRRTGPRSGRGAGRLGANTTSRRVTIKARIIRHRGARFRAAPLAMHLRYLRREGVDRDGRPGSAFDSLGEADHEAFAARCQDDRHHFRFIVSPEDAEQLEDLRATTRDLMARAERDLHTRLEWVAVDHWNTDNPHVHILVRGVAEDGADLVISRDYISRGLRDQAQALVSLELGPRTQKEIAASLDKAVEAQRWTSLDQTLRGRADEMTGTVDLRPRSGRYANGEARLIGRMQSLERLGLARPEGAGRWSLASDLEPRLHALGERGDIIKTLHRAMQGRDPSSISIQNRSLGEPVLGKLVERGLHDELSGQAYAIVDGADGRLHHFRFGDLVDTGDTPPGGLVEIRSRAVEGGRPRIELVHRSDLPLEGQVEAKGATWLDRQMVAREPQPLSSTGFGAQVSDALERRGAELEAMGLASMRGGRRRLARDLIATLRNTELARISANIQAETGLAPIDPAEGDRFGGVYRRRFDLVSGRFAMVEDGLGFQLVPWTRSLEAHLSKEVSGSMTPGGGVDWTMGRKRGIGL